MTELEAQLQLAELRKQNEQLRRARELREAYGIHFYRPHWKQHLFHTCNATGRYCRFGNRTGKTKCGGAEDAAWCLGGRVWYRNSFDLITGVDRKIVGQHVGSQNHPLITKGIPQHAVKGLLVCVSWKKAKEIFTNRSPDWTTMGELFQLLPRESIGKTHTTQGYIDYIEIKRLTEFGGGYSSLYIDTVESFRHSQLSAESSDWDFIHYDEPPPHDMFVANKRGLSDRNGRFWINATPKLEMWVNDEFCPARGDSRVVPAEGLEFTKTESGGNRYIITASIYDNPYNSPAGVAEFESSLTGEEKQCFLHGYPLNLAGLVYKEFIYDVHVLTELPKDWKSYFEPPKEYTIRVAWDVHDAVEQAILFVATAPTGETFVYDELFFSRLIKDNAELLKEKVKGRFVVDYLIDPRAVIESPVTGESIIDELMNFDLFFEKGSKDMELGISKTREKLLERTAGGHPKIWFAPTVYETIREITRYCYNPKTQKPIDKDDHMVENLRRLILTGLTYVAPPSSKDYTSRRQTVIGTAEDLRHEFANPSLTI